MREDLCDALAPGVGVFPLVGYRGGIVGSGFASGVWVGCGRGLWRGSRPVEGAHGRVKG